MLTFITKFKQQIHYLRGDIVLSLINFSCQGFLISLVYAKGLAFSKRSLNVNWFSFKKNKSKSRL